MKPKYYSRLRSTTSTLSAVLVMSLAATTGAFSATLVWDGGLSGVGTELGLAENWSGDLLPSAVVPDTAQWNGSISGPLSLVYGATTLGGAAGNIGINLDVAATQTDALNLDSGANAAALRLNAVSIAAGAGPFSLGNSSDLFNLTLGGATGQTHTWTNQSANVATVNSDVAVGLGGGGTHTLALAGAGDWSWNRSLVPTNTANLYLLKTGAGKATLNAGGSFVFVSTGFPLIAREGTLVLNGGTTAVTGEAVIGGLVTNGAVGQNAKIQVDAGAFNVSTWLSVGRGNGVGTVSSDLEVNNAATVTAGNLSAGFNAGSGLNLPKGSVTLNDTAAMTISANGAFNLAESTGSDMTLTLNDAAQLTAAGTAVKYIGQGGRGTLNINGTSTVNFGNAFTYVGYQAGTGVMNMTGGVFNNVGELRVGGSITNGVGPNGTGTLSISSGVATLGGLTVARGNNNQNTVAGSVTVSGDAVVNSSGDVTLGFAGAGNLGKLTLSGGTLNVGTIAARWLQVGVWDTAKGQLDVSGGVLNVLNGSQIKMNSQGTVGANVINQTGGQITFYSDAGTVVGGVGHLDMQRAGAAASSNAYHLDGGTLTVPQIISSATTGTRVFNFNGGTLKAAAANAAFMNLGAGAARANVRNGGVIIDSNGHNIGIAQALLHSDIVDDSSIDGGLSKLGSGQLTLSSVNSYTGATLVSGGTLALSNSADINSSSSVLINGSGAKLLQTNSGIITTPVTLTQGSFDGNGSVDALTVADSVGNTISAGGGGTGVLTVDALTFQGAATLNLGANGLVVDRSLQVSDLVTSASGDVVINATNSVGAWINGDYPLIGFSTYSESDTSHFTLGDIPGLAANQSAEIINTGFEIVLRVTGQSLVWTGSVSSDWDTSTLNWQFESGDISFSSNEAVLFDDNASSFNVNLVGNIDSSAITFENNGSNDYSLSGAFGITSGSILKNGNAKVTLATSNTYTGSTIIADGVLQIGDGVVDGSIASSSSITNSGNLIFNLVGSSHVYANPISGPGFITKQGVGALTLSGANSFTGDLVLEAGVLNINSASALGSGPGLLTIDGGSIDNTSGSAIIASAVKPQVWNADFSFAGSNDLALGTGLVTLGGDGSARTVAVDGGTLGVGAISGFGYDLVKSGVGTLQLDPAVASVISGTLNLEAGVFNIGSQDFTATGLSGSGTLGNGGATTRWFFLNNDTDFTFTGVVQDGGLGRLGFNKGGAGKLVLTQANYNDTTTVRQGTLRLEGGVSNNLGAASFVGATAYTDAVLELAGANLTSTVGANVWNSSFVIGGAAGSAGSVKVSSGSLTTSRQLAIGGAVNNADQAYGALSQTGGTVTVGGFLAMGLGGASGGDRSLLNLSGGSFTMTGAPATVGAAALGLGVVHLSGTAEFNSTAPANNAFWVGENGSGVVSVADDASFTMANNGIELGKLNVATASGTLNLLGGVVRVNSVTKPGALASGTLNFNGGKLAANAASANFISGLTAAYVHSGGGVVDNGGNSITIPQALLAPTGEGVSSVSLTVEGGGYVNAPLVEIIGDGTGASAVATIDTAGNLTGITMTNPGINYTTPPTFNLLKGGNSNTGFINGQASILPNASGSMTFSGSGTTILSGVNTYTGNSTVDAGSTLALADNAVLKFLPAANGVSNKLTGAGTAVLYGDFNIDLSTAQIADGNAWVLVDSAVKTFDPLTFNVAGFTQASDVWTLVDEDKTWTFTEATGTLTLSVASAAVGFESWAAGFGLDAADQDPADDADGDGFSNLLEYVLGGDPSASAQSIAPSGVRAGSDYVFTFVRSNASEADTTQFVEYGDDLAVWGSYPIGSASSAPVVITENTPSEGFDTVTVTIPTAGAAKFFARLKVVK
jgi:autotransporter-associated beta strand protein